MHKENHWSCKQIMINWFVLDNGVQKWHGSRHGKSILIYKSRSNSRTLYENNGKANVLQKRNLLELSMLSYGISLPGTISNAFTFYEKCFQQLKKTNHNSLLFGHNKYYYTDIINWY